jgi:phosphatidylserine decarboxylase
MVIGGAFLGITVLLWLAFALSGWAILRPGVYFFGVLTIFIVSFFRDPVRVFQGETDAVISAADGVVIHVGHVTAEGFGEKGALRIAVFMSVFNVHINRSPVDGRVIRKKHWPGKKLSAFNKNAEYENEHGDTDLETGHGLVRIRQIAGLIARRVVTRVQEGDTLHRGDRIGLIRFGSRVDVFLPLEYEPAVVPGAHVRAGETVIARLRKR